MSTQQLIQSYPTTDLIGNIIIIAGIALLVIGTCLFIHGIGEMINYFESTFLIVGTVALMLGGLLTFVYDIHKSSNILAWETTTLKSYKENLPVEKVFITDAILNADGTITALAKSNGSYITIPNIKDIKSLSGSEKSYVTYKQIRAIKKLDIKEEKFNIKLYYNEEYSK